MSVCGVSTALTSNHSALSRGTNAIQVPLKLAKSPLRRGLRKNGSLPLCRAAFDPEVSRVVYDIATFLPLNLADVASGVNLEEGASAAASLVSQANDLPQGTVEASAEFVKQQDWLTGFADVLEYLLKGIEGFLDSLHIPYAYGFSIIILTLMVKVLTYPATKSQVESSLAMQDLQPKIKAVQEKYKGDQEKISVETQRLYQQAGVNPLAGCLPALATIPVFLGLYRTLSNVAQEGELSGGFFWIPSLAGPSSLAARQGGTGLSWLFPFVDGHPPLGWETSAAYLVLPVLLVISQYLSMKTLQPANNQNAQGSTPPWLLVVLPFVTAFFALTVPSGLSLYWFVNNVFSTAQQVYLRKFGGAKTVAKVSQIIDAGQAKRSSTAVVATDADKERDRRRAEQFKALKQREAAKKAAEEAARAAAGKEGADRLRISAHQEQASEGEDDDDGEDKPVEDAKKEANGTVQSETKRSKRSRRTRKVT